MAPTRLDFHSVLVLADTGLEDEQNRLRSALISRAVNRCKSLLAFRDAHF